MVGVAQLVRAPDCGPGGRGFKSLLLPHKTICGEINRAKDCGPEGRRFDPDIPPHARA